MPPKKDRSELSYSFTRRVVQIPYPLQGIFFQFGSIWEQKTGEECFIERTFTLFYYWISSSFWRNALTPTNHSQFNFIEVPPVLRTLPFCAVVAEGLSARRKWLPCRFFYDHVGSQLFERICTLPEYYLTRTERAILHRSAQEIVESVGTEIAVVEFGSGSSGKTRLLLDAALSQQRRLHYMPIDISGDFLRASALSLLTEYDRLSVTAIAAEYHDGIAALPDHDLARLILFLGSSIGNFTREEAIDFLSHVRQQMLPKDRLLIGIDLLKDRQVIEAAYNDADGVTARFNKNLMVRVNRELSGDFDLSAIVHHAPFVESESRIEMRLISKRRQRAKIEALEMEFTLEQEEFIHTENSHKYSLAGFASLCRQAGLTLQGRWLDEREWFALLLLQPMAA
jgi:L-histidine N-alpha-methyltransferase